MIEGLLDDLILSQRQLLRSGVRRDFLPYIISSRLTVHFISYLPSFLLTLLCCSHIQMANSSRESSFGGSFAISF